MAASEPQKPFELEHQTKPDPEASATTTPPSTLVDLCSLTDVALRVLLFASAVSAIVVMVTSNQTKVVPVAGVPFPLPVKAKFNHSPAFVYFIVALSVAGLYSIITALASASVIFKPVFSISLLPFFLLWDVVILGIVVSATGAAGAIAYTGLKGNSHVGWNKVCDVYGKFCRYIASSISLGLFASVILLVLIVLSTLSLHKKIPK